jgi:hypothetical protein
MNKRIFLNQCYINQQNLERLYEYMVDKQFWRINKECVTSDFGYQNTVYTGEDRSGIYFFEADVVSGNITFSKRRKFRGSNVSLTTWRKLELHCSDIPDEIFLGKVFQRLDGISRDYGKNILGLK